TLLFGITFAFQNRQDVELAYYFGLHWRGSISLALLAALAIGIAIGYLASLRMVIRMQRQLVQARKEVRQIEQEVMNLRALPITDVIYRQRSPVVALAPGGRLALAQRALRREATSGQIVRSSVGLF